MQASSRYELKDTLREVWNGGGEDEQSRTRVRLRTPRTASTHERRSALRPALRLAHARAPMRCDCTPARPHAAHRLSRTSRCRASAPAALCETSSATNLSMLRSMADSFQRISRPAGSTIERVNELAAEEVVRVSWQVGSAHRRSTCRRLGIEGITCCRLLRAGTDASVTSRMAEQPRTDCAPRCTGTPGRHGEGDVERTPPSPWRPGARRPSSLIQLHAATGQYRKQRPVQKTEGTLYYNL